MIEIQHATKVYAKNQTKAVDDLTLTVEGGELFGFIGPNGAGKSTTVRTLLGLIKPTSGKALIFIMDISFQSFFLSS